MIEVKDLSFAYKDKDVLKNLNLTFKKGEIYGLLGLNGSGKTTFLKLILGLLNEDRGEILLDGRNKKTYREADMAKFIAYVPQSLSITYDFSVLDFLLMGFNPFLKTFERPNAEHEKSAKELMVQMKLTHLLNKSMSALSGGELQMILIARALVQNTDFIIMDEPVSNLDLKNQRYVLDKIQEVGRTYKKAVIVSLHDPNLIRKYCDVAILLKEGKVLFKGSSKDIINKENLREIFGMSFEKIRTSEGNSYFIGDDKVAAEYFNTIQTQTEKGKPVCEAFIVEAEGTTPRSIGTSMLIKSDGSTEGTVGGGGLEYKVIQEGLKFISEQKNGTTDIISYRDNIKKDEIASRVKVFFKVYLPKTRLVIFGGGHVGYHLYDLAVKMHFSVIIADEREGFLSEEKFPQATKLVRNNIHDAIDENLITSETYVVVASSSHQSDEEIMKRVLQLESAYIGMLGSRKKTAEIFRHLTEAGLTEENLKRVYAPIGLEIGGESPEEVALSIMAQIIAIKNGKSEFVKHMK